MRSVRGCLASLVLGVCVLNVTWAGPVGVFDDAVDVGAPPGAGSTTFDGSKYTLRGSGADIWDAGDQFHFAYKRVYGDFRATIRVLSRSTLPAGSGPAARYGLMARWSLGTNAKLSMVTCIFPTVATPTGGVVPFHQFRIYDGVNDGNRINYWVDDGTFPTEKRMPSWMRIERRGNAVYSYLAEDANGDGAPDKWCLVGSDSTTAQPPSVLVGVAVNSQSGANLGAITFDNVSIERLPMAMPLDCSPGAIVDQRSFDSGPGGGASVAAPWSPYTPRATGGRLRLTQENVLGIGAAAWFDVAGSEALSQDGFVAEFDAFMARTGPVGTDLNPADGMTFAVVQDGRDILGNCPDRTEPRVTRLTTSALITAGAGCAPVIVQNDLRDLVPAQTSASGILSEGDIWAGGDTCHFQYARVTGDFDISIEMTGYVHSTGQGRWGKFGLMARQTVDTTSRFTMISAHGPAIDDPARITSRVSHLDPGGPPVMLEAIFPAVGARPRFQRLTRRGNVVQGWVSDNPGLADGSLNPCNDCNWIAGYADDWGASAPATILVGFANSNHNSAGCAEQIIQYRGLPACAPGAVRPSDLFGYGGGGLGYAGGTLRDRTECHPSFAVELDNWVAGPQGEPGNEPFDGGSPSYDLNYHFGLDVNSDISSLQTNVDNGIPTTLLPAIFTPAGIHVRVVYEPNGLVEAYARSNTAPSAEYQVLSTQIPPLGGKLLFGFTAGTGGASATHEVDNLVVRRLVCAPAPPATMSPAIIDLGTIVGGGDGSRDTPAPFAGVDQRNGSFMQSGLDARVNDTDGNYIAPCSSAYIDSVFFLAAPLVNGNLVPQSITQSNVRYSFGRSDVTNSSWNYILKDRNGGVSAPGINVGGLTGFTTSVGIHAAMGVTFDLDALRARHGASNVRCFSTTWGLDSCATGDVNLYAILSSEAGSLAERRFRATANGWQIVQMPIPTEARYLTLATGANGGDNCDRGTFARAVITGAPCPQYSSFTWLWNVVPNLVSTAGGDSVSFSGEFLNQGDSLRVGGLDLANLFYIGPTLVSGVMPPLPPGFYDAEVVNHDGFVEARLRKAVEVAPPLELLTIEPRDVFRDVETQVTVHGANFRPSTVVNIHVYPADDPLPLLDPVFVDESTITGRVPRLPAEQPPGFRKASVIDTRGYAEREAAVQYIDASGVRLTSVAPTLVSTLGGTAMIFTGAGIGEGLVVPRLGGQPLTNVSFQGTTSLTGLSPALPAGLHAADLVRTTGGVLVTLPNAVEAAAPVALTSMTPRDVYPDGTSDVTVNGQRFRPQTRIQIGGRDLMSPVVAPNGLAITGRAPALGNGEPLGLRDVVALDPRGDVTLPGGARYVSPPAVSLTSVSPNLVSTAGGTLVLMNGAGFRAGAHTPRLGGRALTQVVFLSANQLRGVSPSLAAGLHAADIIDPTGAAVVTLTDAVEAAAPVTLSRVDPGQVLSNGRTPVVVRGGSFRSVTRIQIGGRDLVNPVVAGDGASISGLAPALSPGEPVGPRDVTARDPRGDVSLPGGVTYVAPTPAAPGPQEMETSLAEGTARFRWSNPVAYSKIIVTDIDGGQVAQLPGNASFFEIAAVGKDELHLKFVGVINEDTTAPSDGVAMLHECERPAPLMWGGAPGKLNLTLYGQHPPTAVVRCAAPLALGGGGGDEAPDAEEGGGGALGVPIGWMVQHEFAFNALVQRPTQLQTGFVLDTPADKLEIAFVYDKLATAFDLELRCHLKHIYPADGFEDEFTLPDVLIDQGKKLNCITYFRADKDIGHAGIAGDPDPAKQPPKSCQLQIPAGEYLLEVYAVGGDSKLPYYNFADDPHDDEILIAGVPCPPYPLTRVTDLTGLRTLPDITEIRPKEETFLTPVCKDGKIFRRLEALGSWLDELNVAHDVQTDSSPHFEFIWTVYDRAPPRTLTTANRPDLYYCFLDWGCYKIDLRIRDLQCGFEKTRSFEVPIVPGPSQTICAAPFTFLYPTPDPAGLYGVVGLKAPNAPAGQGSFKGKRTLAMRVLVVPQCYCADPDPTDCEGALLGPDPNSDTDDSIQFRLAFKTAGNGRQKVDGAVIRVKDLCPNVDYGAKYFYVEVDDLGTIPPQAGWQERKFYDVFVQGRKRVGNPGADQGWRDVNEGAAKPIKLANRPKSLETTFWSGHFIEADQSYHFTTQSSKDPQAVIPIQPSNAIDLPIPGVKVGVPAYNNELAAGFTARFGAMGGCWFAENGSGASSGELLGNKMSGAPVQVKPSTVGGGAGEGGGGALPYYEWCDHREILSEHFSQTLFESILYTGTIGPIPVTIWASIGLGLDILVESYTRIQVSPFAPLTGGNYAETDFYLLSTTDLSIPCEMRADVLGGLVSIALRLIPAAQFILDTHVWSRNVTPHADLFVNATLDLTMQIEGCLNLLLTKICATATIPILEDEQLMNPIGTNPRPPLECGKGGGAEFAGLAEPPEKMGGGAGIIKFDLPYVSISAPVTVVSPDRKSRMEITFNQSGISTIKVNSELPESPVFGISQGDFLNPAATFVSNRGAIVAWTSSFCADSGLTQCSPKEGDPEPTLAQQNLMHAQQELVISVLTRNKPVNPLEFPHWTLGAPIRIADPVAEVPVAANRRPDGMAAIAADLSTLQDDPPAGEAIVAWVRYDGDYLIQDGLKQIYVNPCADDNPPKACDFVTQMVPNIRPQMELSGIYVRRVDLAGPIGGEGKLKISPPGINVEPAVTLSPTGNVGYCVWVHDPTHTNLIDTNLGRRLLYSVYSGATNTWTGGASVLPNLADYDAKYPGVLEPFMALKDDMTGLLVFTALKAGAPIRDTGLGGSRFVYGVRLTAGVFGEPFLIHGKCLRRQYGWIPQVVYDIPDLIDPLSKFKFKQPDWVMVFQGLGPIGQAEGAGNVLVSVIGQDMSEAGPAIPLMNDGNIHSNVSASLANGVLHTLSLNSGIAKIGAGVGGGAGVPRERFFESVETRLEPDLSIQSCVISDPFPAPGSRVTATVTVENLGFAASPLDENDESVTGLELFFMKDDGSERVVASADLPELQPGESTRIELPIEMPHDPVKVRVQVSPNPVDRDPINDARQCLFGAPAPTEVACSRTVAEDEAASPVVSVTWSNAAVYDEVNVYRDGSMLVSLPGGCERFMDVYPPAETAVYAVRGRMGASKSVRVEVLCPGENSGGERFRRGDVDGGSTVNITDAIAILNYLFTGGRAPLCLKAADADDNGQLQLTDAVRILGFLFLGTGQVPAPGPFNCGTDPTPDALTCAQQSSCQ